MNIKNKEIQDNSVEENNEEQRVMYENRAIEDDMKKDITLAGSGNKPAMLRLGLGFLKMQDNIDSNYTTETKFIKKSIDYLHDALKGGQYAAIETLLSMYGVNNLNDRDKVFSMVFDLPSTFNGKALRELDRLVNIEFKYTASDMAISISKAYEFDVHAKRESMSIGFIQGDIAAITRWFRDALSDARLSNKNTAAACIECVMSLDALFVSQDRINTNDSTSMANTIMNDVISRCKDLISIQKYKVESAKESIGDESVNTMKFELMRDLASVSTLVSTFHAYTIG